jgi:hypothetical protein
MSMILDISLRKHRLCYPPLGPTHLNTWWDRRILAINIVYDAELLNVERIKFVA